MLYKYKTGLLFSGRLNPKDPKPPYKGKAWRATIETFKRKSSLLKGQKEIIISAKSRETAQRTLNLILASNYLFDGDPPLFSVDLVAFRERDLKNFDKNERLLVESKSFGTIRFPIACAIAAKASFRSSLVYAILKYNFSISLYSVCLVDLDPSHSASYIPISIYPSDHIRFCHCIISAYSVLEDLGLEVRASEKQPSFINGKWNLVVKNELDKRLKNAGIDLNETYCWTMRGLRKRLIEIEGPPHILKKESWAYGDVRDSEMEVIDAIAHVSWLRSYVSSHKTKDVTKVLSPYDVINSQHLARRLLLEKLGFWRYYDKY